jgi:fibronectin type 3 domain-containing protein
MRSEITRLFALVGVTFCLASCDERSPLAPEDLSLAKGNSSNLAAPSGTNAIPMLSDRVDVFWTDNSTRETGFRVERSTSGGTTWVTAAMLPANTVALVDEGRTAEQRVCYRVSAVAGTQSSPSTMDCTTPPAAPAGLSATAVDLHTVKLAWADMSAVEDGYYLIRWADAEGSTETLIAEPPANATSYMDANLQSGRSYSYRVRAKKDGGLGSASNIATVALSTASADATPTSSSEVGVTWTDKTTTEDGFRVERSAASAGPWESAATTGPNATSYRDEGRAAEQQVCYRVVAFNTYGDAAPSNADCTTPPAGPSNLTVATAAQGIDVAWADNSAVEDGYAVERSEDGATYSAVAHLPANSTSYHDGGATGATMTYWYRVRAKKDGGFSDFSTVASALGGCVPLGATEVCFNGVADDDCDGLPEWSYSGSDPDCQVSCGAAECPAGTVCAPDGFCIAHCFDGAWNGDEGATDCGGACDAKCQTGQTCSINYDCASGLCLGGRCQ